MPRRKQPIISDALLDQFLDGADAKSAFDPNGLLDALKKALAERMLNAEVDQHLGGEAADGRSNSRYGYGQKTVLTETGRLALDIPRDRRGTFDPQLIPKYQRRFPGFDEKIVPLYARGMSVREIQGHLRELYGIDVSPDLVSTVTDVVLDEVATRQNRPARDRVSPCVLQCAAGEGPRRGPGAQQGHPHRALGKGGRDETGPWLWVEQNEGAKFWLRVMNEPKNRDTEDILIAVVDGLKASPKRSGRRSRRPRYRVVSCTCYGTRWTSCPARIAKP